MCDQCFRASKALLLFLLVLKNIANRFNTREIKQVANRFKTYYKSENYISFLDKIELWLDTLITYLRQINSVSLYKSKTQNNAFSTSPRRQGKLNT